MTVQRFDLDDLLEPVGSEEFLASYWERRHLLLQRGRPGHYSALLTAADLEAIISCSDARYPAIRLAKGGNYYPPEAYTRTIRHGDQSFVGVPEVAKIAAEYSQGATIALPALHRTWPALGELCDRLQARFDHPAHANVYLTPGNTAGFTPHYDTHEVFVLQIAGCKRWSIYPPGVELPHRSQPFTPQMYSGRAPLAEVELSDGDLLYLPRGFLHSTTTSSGFSAHVTIGITVYTWVDLLKEFLQTAVETPALRKALPPGFASSPERQAALREPLLEALAQLRAGADVERLIATFNERVRAAHVPRHAQFKADVNVVTLDTPLQTPAADRYRWLAEDSATVLEFGGVRYPVSAPVAQAIRAMCAHPGSFRGVELADQLDRDSRLTLIRQLTDIGFLTVTR
jgi:ribosomal protein L16 Arg81 hydroxylase